MLSGWEVWPETHPGDHKGASAKQNNQSINHLHLHCALHENGNQCLTTCQTLAFKLLPQNYSLSSPKYNLQISAFTQCPCSPSLSSFQFSTEKYPTCCVNVTRGGGNMQQRRVCKQHGHLQVCFVSILCYKFGSNI